MFRRRLLTATRRSTMSAPPQQSWANMASSAHAASQQKQSNLSSQSKPAIAGGRERSQKSHNSSSPTAKTQSTNTDNERANRKREPSPAHVPRTSSPEKEVYVLTYLTNQKHHQTMTELRNKYFPARLNKLEAHLTLFHALPGSKLEDAIIPTLERTAASIEQFHVMAATPFKLKKGIAIGVPKSAGGDAAKSVHAQLRNDWQPFLSDQDAGGFAAHYTIMNKVDDEKEVTRAFQQVEDSFRACSGTVQGLSLWRYDRGHWEWFRDFEFQKGST